MRASSRDFALTEVPPCGAKRGRKMRLVSGRHLRFESASAQSSPNQRALPAERKTLGRAILHTFTRLAITTLSDSARSGNRNKIPSKSQK